MGTRRRLGWSVVAAGVLVAGLAFTSRVPSNAIGRSDVEHRAVDIVPPARRSDARRDRSLSPEAARRVTAFKRTVRAFANDLARTGRVPVQQAKAIAEVAVTEAYHVGIPPALVIGVMAVESEFAPGALSSVGAIGYMQIMPEVWGPLIERTFGGNLWAPETNVRAGIAILAHYAARTVDWRALLLRYNGCVRGTVTQDCARYPAKVRRAVERYAVSTCRGDAFDQCVVQPLTKVFGAIATSTIPLVRTVE